jgi:hypothetical protein
MDDNGKTRQKQKEERQLYSYINRNDF